MIKHYKGSAKGVNYFGGNARVCFIPDKTTSYLGIPQ